LGLSFAHLPGVVQIPELKLAWVVLANMVEHAQVKTKQALKQ